MSHYQVEGGDPCDWTDWEAASRTKGGACGRAADSWRRYEEERRARGRPRRERLPVLRVVEPRRAAPGRLRRGRPRAQGRGLTDNGWEIAPASFAAVLGDAGRLGLPVLITENGLADGADALRPTFLESHFATLAVDLVGAGVGTVAEGDEVFGFLPYSGSNTLGAFAEYTISMASGLTRKPTGISHAVAAAAATPAITALQSLRDLGRMPSRGRTLIIGASGGVGALGVGVAKKLGAEVVAVCATHAVDFVKGLGAAVVIDRKKEDPLRVAEGPFDVVFDAAAVSS